MSVPEKFYQAVNFHFLVEFSNGAKSVDVRFQSVTGLDSTIDTETVKEGGENRFEHVIPTRRKFGPLILKRGLLGPETSGITALLKQIFEEDPFKESPQETKKNDLLIFKVIDTIVIKLLGEDHQPLMTWTVNNAWPRSWKIAELNAERSEVLIETLEFNYNRLIVTENKTLNPPTPK
ncbi:MAG: phage tail protein [Saprospiraceae bacterium]|uniref:Phage tail protein n=1 Tax=Candidatus Opimibacter skivensis TaxID=2982028 RepID=A0A9D7XUQ6_9BACT|nr:phage tail protein [Candidatus Opimibacter skivensis]